MKTLTINIPDSLDPDVARWELARSLYEKREIKLEQAAELIPMYFKRRLKNSFDPITNRVKQEWSTSAKPVDRRGFDHLVEQLGIQESWEELIS